MCLVFQWSRSTSTAPDQGPPPHSSLSGLTMASLWRNVSPLSPSPLRARFWDVHSTFTSCSHRLAVVLNWKSPASHKINVKTHIASLVPVHRSPLLWPPDVGSTPGNTYRGLSHLQDGILGRCNDLLRCVCCQVGSASDKRNRDSALRFPSRPEWRSCMSATCWKT